MMMTTKLFKMCAVTVMVGEWNSMQIHRSYFVSGHSRI